MRNSLLIITIILLLINCTDNNVSSLGGSTETVGMIYYNTGDKADSVMVVFIPDNYEPKNNIGDSSYIIDTIYSDNNGRFEYSHLNDGIYNIYYEKDTLKALRNLIEIKNGISVDTINDTLKNTITLKGVAKLANSEDCRNIYILFLGSNIYASPDDSLGNYNVKNLAPGEYNLRLITTYEDYGTIDTSIYLSPTLPEVTIDTLTIPFTGIQTPSNFRLTYDSLLMEATLTWNSISSNNVNGYRIFRKIEGLENDFSLLQKPIILDTFFIDNITHKEINENRECLYKIASVEKSGKIGKLSDSIKINYTSNFNINSIAQFNMTTNYPYGGMVDGKDGFIYISLSSSPKIYKIDTTSSKIIDTIIIADNMKAYDIKLMEDSTFIIACDYGIYNISKEGNKLYRYTTETTKIASYKSRYIFYTTNSDFFTSQNSIRILDTYNGMDSLFLAYNSLDSSNNENYNRTITSINILNNTIYIASINFDEVRYECINLETNKHQIIFSCKKDKCNTHLSVNNESISLLSENIVYNLNPNSFEIVSKTKKLTDIIFIVNQSKETIWSLDKNGCLNRINSKTPPIHALIKK